MSNSLLSSLELRIRLAHLCLHYVWLIIVLDTLFTLVFNF